MNVIALFLIVGLLPSCIGGEPSTQPPGGDGRPACGFLCSGLQNRNVSPIAGGTTATLSVAPPSGHESFVIESSDPMVAVADAPLVGAGTVTVSGIRPGTATLTARDAATHEELDHAEVTVAQVDHIEIYYRAAPGVNQPITAAAGIAGRSDAFGVVYRAADGGALAGRGTFAVRGTGLSLPLAQGSPRLSDVIADRQQVTVSFASSGTGELVAGLVGQDRQAVVSLEVVGDAATVDVIDMVLRGGKLVDVPDPVPVDEPVASDIVGRTVDGRFVAGLVATWSSSPAVVIATGTDSVSETIFQIRSPGPVDVTATIGARTVTRHLTAR